MWSIPTLLAAGGKFFRLVIARPVTISASKLLLSVLLLVGIVGCAANNTSAATNQQSTQSSQVNLANQATSTTPPSERYDLSRASQTLLTVPAFASDDPPSSRIRLNIPLPVNVNYTPTSHGQWETMPDQRELWRLRLYTIVGAEMKFNFSPIVLPAGAEMWLVPADGFDRLGPITAADVQSGDTAGNSYWSRQIDNTDVTIELLMPKGMGQAAFDAGNSDGNVGQADAALQVRTVKVF